MQRMVNGTSTHVYFAQHALQGLVHTRLIQPTHGFNILPDATNQPLGLQEPMGTNPSLHGIFVGLLLGVTTDSASSVPVLESFRRKTDLNARQRERHIDVSNHCFTTVLAGTYSRVSALCLVA